MEQVLGAAPLTPWRAPEIADRPAFLAAHPECVVTAELLARLAPEIRRRAAQLDRSGRAELQEDIRSEIVAGIIECATHYRSLDESGSPVFDYLSPANTDEYVVRHAAGKVSWQLRKDRKLAEQMTDNRSVPGMFSTSDVGDDLLVLAPDPDACADASRLELVELATTMAAHLDPAAREVWGLMITGHDRGEIGALLGLPRQRISERCARIRATYESLAAASSLPARRRPRTGPAQSIGA